MIQRLRRWLGHVGERLGGTRADRLAPVGGYATLVGFAIALPHVWTMVLTMLTVFVLAPAVVYIAAKRAGGRPRGGHGTPGLVLVLTGGDRRIGGVPLWRFALVRCAVPAGVWLAWFSQAPVWATMLGWTVLVPLWGRPWWRELASRKPAHPEPTVGPVSAGDRETHRTRANRGAAEWQQMAADLHLPAAHVARYDDDGFAVRWTAELVPGKALTDKHLAAVRSWLASRYGIGEGDVSVTKDQFNARRIHVRLAYADALAETISAPDDHTWDGADRLEVGRLRSGRAIVLNPWLHTLVAGMNGSGKSKLIDLLLRAYANHAGTAIIGIDLGRQLLRWRRSMTEVAVDAGSADRVLAGLEEVIECREETLVTRGVEKWSLDLGPRLVVVVDELASLLRGRDPERFRTLMERARKSGITVVAGVQNPVNAALGGTGEIRAQFPQVVSFAMARREQSVAAFGQDLVSDGHAPHELPGGEPGAGLCYVAGPHTGPGPGGGVEPGRTQLVTGEQIAAVSPILPGLDAATAEALASATPAPDSPAEMALAEIGRPATLREVAKVMAEQSDSEPPSERTVSRELERSAKVVETGRSGRAGAKLYALAEWNATQNA